MKKLFFAAFILCTVTVMCAAVGPDSPATNTQATGPSKSPIKVGIINFKNCVEQSKMGQQEDANYEALRTQVESIFSEKEKTLNDLEEKLNDPDYRDSLSPEGERELRRKYRALSEEASLQQNQYVQTLQQANMKIIQKMADLVTKLSAKLAKSENFDLILTEESSFYYAPTLDLTSKIVSMLDEEFEKEGQTPKPQTVPAKPAHEQPTPQKPASSNSANTPRPSMTPTPTKPSSR
jgi:outer membrane protein